MDIAALDQVRLNFNPQGLFAINAAIGLMMLGVALELKLDDFKRILIAPKAPGIGLGAQFIFLPAFTFLLTLILRPPPLMLCRHLFAPRSIRQRFGRVCNRVICKPPLPTTVVFVLIKKRRAKMTLPSFPTVLQGLKTA